MRQLLCALYAPAFSLGMTGAGIVLIHEYYYSHWLLLLLLLIAIALSSIAELALPYDAQANQPRNDRWRDVIHALVNEALTMAGLTIIPLVSAILPVRERWPHAWPLWLQVILSIVIADFGITMVHWASHQNILLWRLHAVHHSVRRMYGLNGLMKHPLHQALETLGGVTPLLLLGMPVGVAAVLAYAVAIQLLLQHSNVDMQLGPLRHVMAWAPVHRFHHIKYGTAGDVNFALFFCVWDSLLGTAYDHYNHRITLDDLGIGSQPNYPDGYLAQLVEPFVDRAAHVPVPPLPAALRRGVMASKVAASS